MRGSHDYRRYAAECLDLATATSDPQARLTLQHMAQVWLRLADQRDGGYRTNAADCLSLATTTADPQARTTLTRMADDWLRLTEEAGDGGSAKKAE